MTELQQLTNVPHLLNSPLLHVIWQPGTTWTDNGTYRVWLADPAQQAVETTEMGTSAPLHTWLAEQQIDVILVDQDICSLSGESVLSLLRALAAVPGKWILAADAELFVRVFAFAKEIAKRGEYVALALPTRLTPEAALGTIVRMAETGDDAPIGASGNGRYSAMWIPTWRDIQFRALRRLYEAHAQVHWKQGWQTGCGWRQRDHAQILLDLWICKAVDHWVRVGLTDVVDALSSSEQKTNYRVMYRGEEEVFTHWRRALQSDDRGFEADGWLVTRVVRQGLAQSGWRGQTLFDASGAELYVVSFELSGPKSQDDDWALCAFVTHRVFGTRWPLQDYWKQRARVWEVGRDALEHPDEWILTALHEAGKVYAPITAALASRTPWRCRIVAEAVYEFITDALPRLVEAGYVIHTPALDNAEPSNVRIRVHVKRSKLKAQTGGGGGQGIRWFDAEQLVEFDWGVAIDNEEISKAAFTELVEKRTPYVQLGGSWKLVPLDEILKQVDALSGNRPMGSTNLLDVSRLMLQGEDAASATNAVEVDIAFDDEAMDVAQVMRVLATAHEPTVVDTPASFHGTLRHYQAVGFSWLLQLRSIGCGACLADDMGLGKTIQVLAYLLHLKEHGEQQGIHLLICPTSLLQNWKREIARFAPSLNVYIHHGSTRHQLEHDVHPLDAALAYTDLVLTTYATVVRDAEMFQSRGWDAIVVDEAQNIKNAQTKQSEAVRQLTAVQRIALTGTPVENRLDELWAIFQFANPGYLGNRAWFRRVFAEPITNNPHSKQSQRLQRLLRPVLLRRRKTEPSIQIELPEKWEMRAFAALTVEQATVYQSIVNQLFTGIDDRSAMSRRGHILAALVRLKQVCDHPCLVTGGNTQATRSGKLKLLLDLMEDVVAEGEAALVFTQFRDMGELLCDALQAHFGWRPKFLHGGLTATARGNMVEAFQSGSDPCPVFVLSLKAGGVGLNLTRANHVFHYDRWWNPAVEDQATDRAFRIGQQRDVQVHKLVCSGTLEERIDALIEAKRQLSAAVIGESSEAWVTELDDESLRQLFMLDEKLAVEEED